MVLGISFRASTAASVGNQVGLTGILLSYFIAAQASRTNERRHGSREALMPSCALPVNAGPSLYNKALEKWFESYPVIELIRCLNVTAESQWFFEETAKRENSKCASHHLNFSPRNATRSGYLAAREMASKMLAFKYFVCNNSSVLFVFFFYPCYQTVLTIFIWKVHSGTTRLKNACVKWRAKFMFDLGPTVWEMRNAQSTCSANAIIIVTCEVYYPLASRAKSLCRFLSRCPGLEKAIACQIWNGKN